MFTNKKKYLLLLCGLPIIMVGAIATPTKISQIVAQTPRTGGAMTVRSDIQEANSQTGVITARGNVQINYPARKIQATSAQAQYFSRERRLVLSGNVYVLQEGNSMRAETMTYLVDEGRFIATPQANQQVESIYIVSDPESTNQNPVSVPPAPSLNRQP
ncbi:MAG: ostA-like family protein [Hydrococcus sp. RU_2_2]|nr:ostA-like family protein [Hydrococcus sp. RU_2_2]NJP18944.1 ostA-like family protein [Hydrococcus sp. CRU_1_1]